MCRVNCTFNGFPPLVLFAVKLATGVGITLYPLADASFDHFASYPNAHAFVLNDACVVRLLNVYCTVAAPLFIVAVFKSPTLEINEH